MQDRKRCPACGSYPKEDFSRCPVCNHVFIEPEPEQEPKPDEIEQLAGWAKAQTKAKLEAIEKRVKEARAAYNRRFENPEIDKVTVKIESSDGEKPKKKRRRRRKRRKKGGRHRKKMELEAPNYSRFMKPPTEAKPDDTTP
jgi:rubredoxin